MILSLSWCSRKIDAVISGQSRLFFDRSATSTNVTLGTRLEGWRITFFHRVVQERQLARGNTEKEISEIRFRFLEAFAIVIERA
jgi:hypothetical protein